MNPEAYLNMAETETSHWWFYGRRAVLSRLIQTLNLAAHASILEVGAGTGGNLEMLSSFGSVSAVEMDAAARTLAAKKTNGRFDIRAGVFPSEIPFEGQRFDLVCLFDVLEHIDGDLETLVAIKSLLAEGGRVLITVPAYQWLWSAHDDFLHHKRRYSPAGLREKVLSAGFSPVKLSYFNTLLFPAAAIARLKDRFLGKASSSRVGVPPYPLNRLLGWIFALERFLVPKVRLPFGVSLICVLEAKR